MTSDNPLCAVREGSVSDRMISQRFAGSYSDSSSSRATHTSSEVISPIPHSDKNNKINHKTNIDNTPPPSPKESEDKDLSSDNDLKPTHRKMSREEIRFLADIEARPLSATVSRYHRLHLSRRRGNAVRQSLLSAGIIEAVTIPTRSGQVVLYQLTDPGRVICSSIGIALAPKSRESLEHRFWVNKVAGFFEKKGYDVIREHPVKGNGAIDLLARKSSEQVAVEIETGKSDIKTNLKNILKGNFARTILVATSANAITACQKTVSSMEENDSSKTELLSWPDIS